MQIDQPGLVSQLLAEVLEREDLPCHGNVAGVCKYKPAIAAIAGRSEQPAQTIRRGGGIAMLSVWLEGQVEASRLGRSQWFSALRRIENYGTERMERDNEVVREVTALPRHRHTIRQKDATNVADWLTI